MLAERNTAAAARGNFRKQFSTFSQLINTAPTTAVTDDTLIQSAYTTPILSVLTTSRCFRQVDWHVCKLHGVGCSLQIRINGATIHVQATNIHANISGSSIGDVIDDVTWLYDVILVTPQYSKSSKLIRPKTWINCPREPFMHVRIKGEHRVETWAHSDYKCRPTWLKKSILAAAEKRIVGWLGWLITTNQRAVVG